MPAVFRNVCSILFFIGLCGKTIPANTQTCKPDVFSIKYTGNAAYSAFQTIRTSQNEIVSVGNVLQVDGGFAYDAWAYKLSSRGTVLWAKRYMPAGYNTGHFNTVASLPDGSCLVAGRFAYERKRFPDNQVEVLYSMTFIASLDAFGNLIWMKTFLPYKTYYTSIESLTVLPNGDIAGAASVFGNRFKRQLLFCMDSQAQVKWCTALKDNDLNLSGVTFKQLRSGRILVAGWAYKGPPDFSVINKQGFYLHSINPENGRTIWSRSFFFTTTPRQSFLSTSSVRRITETSDGRICLFSSFSDSAQVTLYPYTQKGLMMQVDETGVLRKAIGFAGGNPGFALADAVLTANDDHLLLLNDADMPVVARVNKEGAIIWQKGYGKLNGNIAGSSLFEVNNLLQVYSSGRSQVAMSGLLQAEENGSLPCMETASRLFSRDMTSVFVQEEESLFTEPHENELFETTLLGLNRKNYNLQSTISCVISCCTDIASDTTAIALCNQPSYRLPNGATANESGLYYTQHKTANGCDSIAYYAIQLDRTPQVSLGDDVCLDEKDSVVLRATSGFDRYNWMGMAGNDSALTVKATGFYWVSVKNNCGQADDTIQVHAICDYPVHIPDAFTPNNDGKNDIFRYPPLAKNRFVRLVVFNRWGQKVFETREASRGWNGSLNNIPQPIGTYVYLLETTTLNGRKKQQKGTITLIR
jgi:gliding motility-associated-like protein